MAISQIIKIKNNVLPDSPGVYFYFDKNGDLLYIGKATSLKRRVGSYFNKKHGVRLEKMVSEITKIDYIETPTVIEALVLEANQIKAKQPKYNILGRDDKTFLYLSITNEDFPKPILIRGQELERMGINPFESELSEKTKKKFLSVYGPFTSGSSLRKALDFLRKIIPWTECKSPEITGKTRPCFYRHIKKCPGVCTGEISKTDYRKIIRQLMLFFEGNKKTLIKNLEKEMKSLSKDSEFEQAAQIRNRINALLHIQDVALITKEDIELPFSKNKEGIIDLDGRIEAYDISNISGTSAVGVMTVFEGGKPVNSKYRKFKIKTVKGANDVAMMEEVIRRRLLRAEKFPVAWQLPVIMVIDGGKPQVNRVQKIFNEFQLDIPIVGLAKGFDRKQDRLIFDRSNIEISRVLVRGKEIFQRVRDEAHRFAIKYHRELRSKNSGIRY